MHAVGITQSIGRITGCARPDLKRRVYAPKDVIETYKRTNENQEKYISKLSNNNQSVKELIDSMEFKKLKRNIDKPKLKAKVSMNWTIEEQDDFYEDDKERIRELVKRWWKAKTIIGKILMYVFEHEKVSEKDLKGFIKSLNTVNVKSQYDELVKSDRKYNLVFSRNHQRYTCLSKRSSRNYSKNTFVNLV
ncbi:hypothetical protein SAGO17_0024 [Mimivirus AB-566-O17]|uniref:Uncharacterized protein n=1 Tax=Mimivirus AB-566-O17 TaxID=1988039 RepID=A0A1X9VNN9_9VIRU|nr:hypothetical protein SAGO17_0024 [Mimivirus AB-566-O17]